MGIRRWGREIFLLFNGDTPLEATLLDIIDDMNQAFAPEFVVLPCSHLYPPPLNATLVWRS